MGDFVEEATKYTKALKKGQEINNQRNALWATCRQKIEVYKKSLPEWQQQEALKPEEDAAWTEAKAELVKMKNNVPEEVIE
jgi:hypothetical protein